MLRHRHFDCVPKNSIRRHTTIGEERRNLRLERVECGRVETRRCEVEIHQLEQRLEILRRRAPPEPFCRFIDGRHDGDRLSCQLLLQIDSIEISDAAELHDLIREIRGHDVCIRRE